MGLIHTDLPYFHVNPVHALWQACGRNGHLFCSLSSIFINCYYHLKFKAAATFQIISKMHVLFKLDGIVGDVYNF